MSKRLDDFMINVFPYKTFAVCLLIIAACEIVQVFQGFLHLAALATLQ